MIRTAAAGGGLLLVGIVLMAISGFQLGVARAVRTWPSQRRPRLGRGVATIGVAIALVLVTTGAAMLGWLVPVLGRPAHTAAAVIAAVVAFGLALVIVAKAVDRVELRALIRTPAPLYTAAGPAPGSHPEHAHRPSPAPRSGVSELVLPVRAELDDAVPGDAQPGWVYRDASGAWLLAVAAEEGDGHRLVRLTDFAVLPTGVARQPLVLTGSVELSVWPIDGAEPDAHPGPGPQPDPQRSGDTPVDSEPDRVEEGAA